MAACTTLARPGRNASEAEATASYGAGRAECWPTGLSANIGGHYLARGLYAAQLAHYQRAFPPRQLLVLADTELQAAPNATLNRVFAHVGLAPRDMSGVTDALLYRAYARAGAGAVVAVVAAVVAARGGRRGGIPRRPGLRILLISLYSSPCSISATWPRFEETSGWRLHASYAPLDPALKAELVALYAPHVVRLRRQTGRDFAALWAQHDRLDVDGDGGAAMRAAEHQRQLHQQPQPQQPQPRQP